MNDSGPTMLAFTSWLLCYLNKLVGSCAACSNHSLIPFLLVTLQRSISVQPEMKRNYLHCLVINQNYLVIFTDDPKL